MNNEKCVDEILKCSINYTTAHSMAQIIFGTDLSH